MAYPQDKGGTGQTHNTGYIAYVGDGNNFYPMKANSSGHIIISNTETIQTEILTTQAVAASTQVLSTEFSLIGVKKATFFIDHARAGSAAFGTNGTEYRIEIAQKGAGNDTWRAMTTVTAGSALAMTCAASGNYTAGAGTIIILSGTAVTLGDKMFWPSGAASSSEWMKVAYISGTANFTILDPMVNNHAAASSIIGSAEQWVIPLNVEAVTRARIVVNNNASGTTQAIYSRVAYITEI